MKKIQITQDLFVKILLTQFQEEATTPNIKQLILLKQKNTQGRSILMLWVCTEISDIDSLLTT